MSFLKFQDVNFSYPPLEGDVDEDGKQIVPPIVFDHFSAELPAGFVSLVGPNGSGKSTFMLLAAGRILPVEGKVELFGKDTRTLSQEERDERASYIYQNMELETEDECGALLQFVYKNGLLGGAGRGIRNSENDFLDDFVRLAFSFYGRAFFRNGRQAQACGVAIFERIFCRHLRFNLHFNARA